MSLFRDSLRPPATLSDEAIERYVAAIRSQIQPDPFFRRRLRGHVMNRYVAAREGHPDGRPLAKEMGRIGRAVLYSSFALGVSVTGVMAGSQQAIPGDLLYPLKRHIEELRVHILPAHFQDELAAHNLGQRIEELHRLADAGMWAAVVAQVEAVETAYGAVLASPGNAESLGAHVAVVTRLIEQLPEPTRIAVENVMTEMPYGTGRGEDPGASPTGGGNLGGANNTGTNPNGSTNQGGANNDGSSGNPPEHASTNNGSSGPGDRGRNATEPGEEPTEADPASSDADPSPTPKPAKGPKPSKSSESPDP